MFDAILRSKFYSKCKSEIKMTRRRIEIIKRKRNAMQKFLRNDVADLLKNGLDSNAYSRVEQLYVDQNLSSCYEFVEQSCLLILNHLSAMDKQRECPEECRESIPTLMFAAARFADLPELRELRTLFSERYGNSLEPYVNKEFMKNLKAEIPSDDIKNVMMLEITLEYGIEWAPKASEHKLYKPPQFVQDSCENVNERNKQLPKLHHQNVVETTEKKQSKVAKKEHTVENEFPYKYKSWAEAEVETKNNKQRTGNSLPYKSRGETEKKEKKEGEEVKVKHSPYWSSTSSSSSRSSCSTTSQDDSSSSSSSASEDVGGVEGRKFYDKPDKYTQSASKGTCTLRSVGPPYIKTEVATNSNATLIITPPKQQPAVPRSMRVRRPLKAVSGSHGHNEISKETQTATPKVSYHDDEEEEEEEENNNKSSRERKRQSVSVHAPTRITSLPVEVESLETEETKKGLARAVTDLSQGHGHVHPKLPDYDDFVARLAAFRATNSTK
ncbi:unnamed protein product [Lactuca saligna]|uniref:IST1-like protein n=1 Tax=Lactuca saligna TaxID=75948 RepID=A0AA36E346_LACSI|nr:unnamed protein product [Lactuca saligna]